MALLDPERLAPALDWRARKAFVELAKRFRAQTGLDLKIRKLGGRRTCAQQAQIYSQGREQPGEIATYAYGCQTWHVLGRAIDADPVDPKTGRVVNAYATAGAIMEAMGGKWGGNFPGFADVGHFEWHPGVTVERACPNPAACEQTTLAIVTKGPESLWLYAGSGLLLGLAGLWYARRAKKLRAA